METHPNKVEKKTKAISPHVYLRVRRETKRKVATELARVNRKQLGRGVTLDELLLLTICPVKDEHIRALQEATYSNADRIEMAFRDYLAMHPGTTKDAYLGILFTTGTASKQVPSPTLEP